MLIAGIGIPIMGALSAGLGVRFQNPSVAPVMLCFVGLVLAVIFLVLVEGVPTSLPTARVPIQYYLAGFFIFLYTLSITWVGPRFGIGNAIAFVLLGQLISMTVIDHFGLLGAIQYPLSLQRLLGLLLMALGIFLVVKRF
jgi:transporter family-2 protein